MAAKVRRDDKGVYWVVVHHDGRRRKKRVGRDKRLAEEIARKIQARLVLGDFTMETEQKAPVPFRRFARDWLRREVELPIERGLEGHHAPGTARVYRLQVEIHLGPHFEDVESAPSAWPRSSASTTTASTREGPAGPSRSTWR